MDKKYSSTVEKLEGVHVSSSVLALPSSKGQCTLDTDVRDKQAECALFKGQQ